MLAIGLLLGKLFILLEWVGCVVRHFSKLGTSFQKEIILKLESSAKLGNAIERQWLRRRETVGCSETNYTLS